MDRACNLQHENIIIIKFSLKPINEKTTIFSVQKQDFPKYDLDEKVQGYC